MATQAQVDANQANSQKSTGPKTPQGKAASSRNRLSHGFASSTRFVQGEDPAEFNLLLDDLISEHQPATPTEQILVEQMAHHHWISMRATRLQDSEIAIHLKLGMTPTHLPVFIRYQTAAERSFYKAHTELLKVQKQRQNSKIGFETDLQNSLDCDLTNKLMCALAPGDPYVLFLVRLVCRRRQAELNEGHAATSLRSRLRKMSPNCPEFQLARRGRPFEATDPRLAPAPRTLNAPSPSPPLAPESGWRRIHLSGARLHARSWFVS